MERLLALYLRPLRAPEGGGGGGGGDGGGGDGGAGDASFQYPDGFPDQFKGATLEESFGKLFGGFTETNTRAEGLRTQLATRPKAPDTPDGYAYKPSDKLAPYFGDIDQNPVFAQARQAFHKHGIPAEAFSGIIEDLYGPLAEQGHLAQPFNPQAEVSTFMKEMNLDARGATSALSNTESFAKGLFSQLKVPESLKADVEAHLMGLTDTAAGNVLLHALSSRLSENGIRIAGESQAAGELTAEDLKKLDADPRIDPNNRGHQDPNQRYDEDLRRRYDEAYKRLAPANKTAW